MTSHLGARCKACFTTSPVISFYCTKQWSRISGKVSNVYQFNATITKTKTRMRQQNRELLAKQSLSVVPSDTHSIVKTMFN